MKKLMAAVLTATVATGLLAGCSTGNGGNGEKGSEAAGKQEVTMWGSMSGDAVEYINQMTENYNNSQEVPRDIRSTGQYGGEASHRHRRRGRAGHRHVGPFYHGYIRRKGSVYAAG